MKRIMSEHGRAIWKAWADGKEVQYKVIGGKWEDTEPISVESGEQPQNYPSVWRIKPPPQVLRYRIWLMKCDDMIRPMVHDMPSGPDDTAKYESDAEVERLESFIRWDGPARVTEVEVDE